MPFGVTLVGPAFSDPMLLGIASEWLGESSEISVRTDATPTIDVAVVGAHLTGQPLNGQLIERGATRVAATTTSPDYRLYALDTRPVAKPGLLRVASQGTRIALEVWRMPVAHFGSFVELIGAPLGIGSVELDDGTVVKGFICEPYALTGARDITEYGGWLAYLETKARGDGDTAANLASAAPAAGAPIDVEVEGEG
jgi:allophanate hydrolase